MVKENAMTAKEFIDTHNECDEELLKKMYKYLEEWNPNTRLFKSKSPLYECDNGRIYGGGDCLLSLSQRNGYGFTIINVGDRGCWRCNVSSEIIKDREKIIFIDGDFQEIYEQLKGFCR